MAVVRFVFLIAPWIGRGASFIQSSSTGVFAFDRAGGYMYQDESFRVFTIILVFFYNIFINMLKD